MNTTKQYGILSLPVIVAALGYFVDIYDLLLFSIIRVPSLQSLGLNETQIADEGLKIINIQMIGLLVGGILWGILGDKLGRMKVLFASIILYSLGNIANGFVETVNQYATIRFISGIGLAGELGASITLVAEILSKEKRGLGTSVVAGIGLTGAVFAFIMKENFDWRTCYFIGGGMGFMLLFLRASVLESSMFNAVKKTQVIRGNFMMLLNNKKRLSKYIKAILIGLPTWYVIGILISFSDKFAKEMNVVGKIDPGKSVMFAYVAISIGDLAVGFISNWIKSRKKAMWFFYGITILGIIWFFNLNHQTNQTLYWASALLGFGTGFWALFVTMSAEQFGTNIRATVTTTTPNMVRGSLVFISIIFTSLHSSFGYLNSGWITGIIIMLIAMIALYFTEETFGKDLNYVEE
ncbi:MAG: MFS transporter [Chitinophagaceae bacterium]|nr:MFS transporter [Chitinophagaceae bacterium]